MASRNISASRWPSSRRFAGVTCAKNACTSALVGIVLIEVAMLPVFQFSERGRQRSRWPLDEESHGSGQVRERSVEPAPRLAIHRAGARPAGPTHRHTLPTVVEFSSEDVHPPRKNSTFETTDDALAWEAARPCQHCIAQRSPDWRTTSAQLDPNFLCSGVRAIGITRLEPGVPPPGRHSTPGLSMGGTGFGVATVRRRSTVGPGSRLPGAG